jgi:phosphoribosylanthranilate isomerase
LYAEEEGADAIGIVVSSNSPRSISLERASEILNALGPFTAGICVTHTRSHEDIDEILAIHPSAVQCFHPFTILQTTGVKIIRAVKMGDPIPHDCDALIVDGSHGQGRPFDPAFARKVVRESPVPVILAGGLTPENVRDAIEQVRPHAVDVASGVEESPGVKDRTKVRAFIRACRSD